MVTIPFKQFPQFTESILLDGTSFKFQFTWNTRGTTWNMAIFDTDENLLASGFSLVMSYELISNFPGRGLPPGQIYVIDPSNTIRRVTFDNIDADVFVVYIPEAEVQELEAAQ